MIHFVLCCLFSLVLTTETSEQKSNLNIDSEEAISTVYPVLYSTLDNDGYVFGTLKPLTKTKRATEFPKNDDDMLDHTIYVNRIEEAILVLKREILVYTGKGDAGNYSLVVLEKNYGFRIVCHISELFKIPRTHLNGTLGLDFDQRLLLYNKVFHRFELWWMIRRCSELAVNFINKCRVLDLESDEIRVNVPMSEVPKSFLIHNLQGLTFSKISGISIEEIECYCMRGFPIIKCSDCLHETSLKYFLFTIYSTTDLKLLTFSPNSLHSINFEVLDISQIISIHPLTEPRKVYINVDLVHDKTRLLFQFTSRNISSKPNIYLINCSTYDGKNGRRSNLCELTSRKTLLHGRKKTKLQSDENVILNIKTARSASYLLKYAFSTGNGIEVERIVEMETVDRRYMRSACFNESMQGCERIVSYISHNGDESIPCLNRSRVIHDVRAEQTMVVCNSSNLPLILCTPRTMTQDKKSSLIEHVPRDKSIVLLLSILCGSVAILGVGAGYALFRIRKSRIEKKCIYHTYTKPDNEVPPLEVDYTGIEILYSDI